MKSETEIKQEIGELQEEEKHHSKELDYWTHIEKQTDSISKQQEATHKADSHANQMNTRIDKITALLWVLGED